MRLSRIAGLVSAGSDNIDAVSVTMASNDTSISFTVQGEPKAFALRGGYSSAYTLNGSNRIVVAIMSDGGDKYGLSAGYGTTSGTAYYYETGRSFTWSYSGGVFTITSAGATTGGQFIKNFTYWLVYIY